MHYKAHHLAETDQITIGVKLVADLDVHMNGLVSLMTMDLRAGRHPDPDRYPDHNKTQQRNERLLLSKEQADLPNVHAPDLHQDLLQDLRVTTVVTVAAAVIAVVMSLGSWMIMRWRLC